MKIIVKNTARLSLLDLLKRRKTKLEIFINEMAIASYEALVDHCEMMGVQPPSLEVCEKLFSDKQIEVLEAPKEDVTLVTLSDLESLEYSSSLEDVVQPQATKEKKKKKTLKQNDTSE